MPRAFGTWLSGSPLPDSRDGTRGVDDFPGQRLGLPAEGPGSLAGTGRRLGALFIDWFIAVGLTALAPAFGFAPDGFMSTSVGQTVIAAVWLVMGAISVRLFTFTPGQLALGMTVASVVQGKQVGIGRALVRGLLVALVVPPLFTDLDGRGIQDRATGTAIVRR